MYIRESISTYIFSIVLITSSKRDTVLKVKPPPLPDKIKTTTHNDENINFSAVDILIPNLDYSKSPYPPPGTVPGASFLISSKMTENVVGVLSYSTQFHHRIRPNSLDPSVL